MFLEVPGWPLPTQNVLALAVLRREPPSLVFLLVEAGPVRMCCAGLAGGSSDREAGGRDEGLHSFRRPYGLTPVSLGVL